MRKDGKPPHISHEPFRVEVLVGTKRFLVRTCEVCFHLLGGLPITDARGLCDAAIDDQGMKVDHEHMDPVAQLSGMGIGFAGQQSYRSSLEAELLFSRFLLIAAHPS